MFNPDEIIFAATTACNLHCPHCFVNRQTTKLAIEDAIAFMNSAGGAITKIGFSGGEPFLYTDFLIEITKAARKQDLMFDQIMTNGDWWKTPEDLEAVLRQIYDAGYDGKIGLSWDDFHGQKEERMLTFIQTVQKVFGPDSINIQYVKPYKDMESDVLIPCNAPSEIAHQLGLSFYELPQTFQSGDKRAWQAKKWFKDDYCEGPGQILYIHPTGDIAPCCGFTNENPKLFIGTIKESFSQVMEKAENNPLIKICYETGLGKYRKQMKKQLKKEGKKLPGKCGDICSFCDFVCKNFPQ